MRAIFITLLLIPLMLVSQTPEETIKEMKDGSMLVRLMTREKSIQALEEIDKPDEAQALRDKQREENLEVISAFEEEFDFCRLYYFYTSDSKALMEGELNGYLMDASLIPIPEDEVSAIGDYFIAEFGTIEPAEKTYFRGYSLEENDDGSKEIRANYGGDTEIGATALIIRNAEFKQLGRPFPYYVRTREGLPWSRSTIKTISKLNENLHDYYRKCQ